MGAMTRAVPRSGSKMMNSMGKPAASANLMRVASDSRTPPILAPVRMEAVMMSTASLALSEGWKEAGPKSIQRRAPIRATPMPGMRTSSSRMRLARYTQWAQRSHSR